MPRLRRQLLALVPLLGWAAAPLPASDEARPTSDAISATRRDLEALKSDRNLPTDSSKVALPTIDAPDVAPSTTLVPAGPLPPNAPPTPGQPRRSNSWLIDAMEGNAGGNSLTGGANQTNSLQQLMLGEDARGRTGKGSGDPRARSSLSDTAKRGRDGTADSQSVLTPLKEAAPNPLAGYMAGWMTSRDFNLLLKSETGGPSGLPGGISGPANGPGETFSPSSAFFSAAIGGPVDAGPMRSGGPPGATENPYLQALTPAAPFSPVPPALALPPSPAPAPFPSVRPPTDNPAPVDRLELARPELQKRENDAKYFPQLKRF